MIQKLKKICINVPFKSYKKNYQNEIDFSELSITFKNIKIKFIIKIIILKTTYFLYNLQHDILNFAIKIFQELIFIFPK